MSENVAKFQYINLLRLIAIILVIALHVGSLFVSSQGLDSQSHDYFFYEFSHRVGLLAVPIFVLISGSLLLNPSKKITYQTIFSKYISRIVRALLLFGLIMCLMESYVMRSSEEGLCAIILKALENLLTGKCWTHMWYLYMLIELYALTPVCKAFFNNVPAHEQHCLIDALACMCVILSFVKTITPIESWIVLPVFLFLYPFGYWVVAFLKKSKTSFIVALMVLILYIAYMSFSVIINLPSPYILYVISAVSIFHLCRFFSVSGSVILDHLAKHCFYIYITHAVFLNVLFKVLHVEKIIKINACINLIVVVIVTFLLSYIT